MIPYADTNCFTRLYLELDGAETARRWVDEAMLQATPPLPVTWLTELEIINAFQRCVFVARPEGRLRVTPEFADAAQAEFRSALTTGEFVCPTQMPYSRLKVRFEELALRHTAKHGFRTYDLLHVASALLLGCDTFWSFDLKARDLAILKGLRVPDLA
jgi:predicted nucleic acid-binding protein